MPTTNDQSWQVTKFGKMTSRRRGQFFINIFPTYLYMCIYVVYNQFNCLPNYLLPYYVNFICRVNGNNLHHSCLTDAICAASIRRVCQTLYIIYSIGYVPVVHRVCASRANFFLSYEGCPHLALASFILRCFQSNFHSMRIQLNCRAGK